MSAAMGEVAAPEAANQAQEVKSCCAQFYESDVVRFLFGESFHPGGLALTTRLGEILGLKPSMRLLDVAAGRGTSALHLAETFGCEVVGVDFGAENVRLATEAAAERGLAERVRFVQGDAERLPFDDASFDAVVCECAYCTFPDKPQAAREFFRVLKPGGQVGLSDLTRRGPLAPALETLLAWVACIADARPVEDYTALLAAAGFAPGVVEPHDAALGEMVASVRAKLLGAELMVALKKLTLPDVDFPKAKQVTQSAADAVARGELGYAIITAVKAK
ncbi:MAG: methyltransferase domain-containing protein [Chloracidobacterium sp.]|nr:methyltransferase domain-containing protein [Chloracidobacterium sp.]MDW8217112.1 methyltransferase domain-containing protein [Acidobacteriota bacterium]